MPSALVALGAATAVTAMGWIGTGLQGWHTPTGLGAEPASLGAGLFLIVGYLTSVSAMRHGDIGMVAPFRYTSLLWAIALGFLVFGNLPDGWTLLGALIVVWRGALHPLARAQAPSPDGLTDPAGLPVLTPPRFPLYARQPEPPPDPISRVRDKGSERLKWS